MKALQDAVQSRCQLCSLVLYQIERHFSDRTISELDETGKSELNVICHFPLFRSWYNLEFQFDWPNGYTDRAVIASSFYPTCKYRVHILNERRRSRNFRFLKTSDLQLIPVHLLIPSLSKGMPKPTCGGTLHRFGGKLEPRHKMALHLRSVAFLQVTAYRAPKVSNSTPGHLD